MARASRASKPSGTSSPPASPAGHRGLTAAAMEGLFKGRSDPTTSHPGLKCPTAEGQTPGLLHTEGLCLVCKPLWSQRSPQKTFRHHALCKSGNPHPSYPLIILPSLRGHTPMKEPQSCVLADGSSVSGSLYPGNKVG